MNKFYLSALLIGSMVCSLNAQLTTFEIKNKTGGTQVVSNNEIFYHTTSPSATTEHGFDMKNISSNTITILVRRYDDQINTVNASDMALAYYCTGSICYNSATTTSSVVLAPNETMEFKAYLDEATVMGESQVRYKFSSGSDVLFIDLKYNSTNSIKKNTLFGNVSSIYPNPASSQAFFKLELNRASNVSFKIMNALGSVVMSEQMNLSAGKNTIPMDLESLPAGIYFVSVENGTSTIVRKITVSQ